jgi:hypothetical protein
LRIISWLKTHANEDLILIHAPAENRKEMEAVLEQILGERHSALGPRYVEPNRSRKRTLPPSQGGWLLGPGEQQ